MTTLLGPLDDIPAVEAASLPAPSSAHALIPRTALYAAAAVAVCGLWAAAIWTAGHLHTDPLLHQVALFAHLAFLVIGFGAVLTLDWFGALWLLGKRSLSEVLRMSAGAHLMIWLGLAGLTASGTLLNPALHQLTWIKLGAVLAIALNGINAHQLQSALQADLSGPSRRVLLRAALTGAISQAGWWTACLIGYLNRG
jgi:hypothetical protein